MTPINEEQRKSLALPGLLLCIVVAWVQWSGVPGESPGQNEPPRADTNLQASRSERWPPAGSDPLVLLTERSVQQLVGDVAQGRTVSIIPAGGIVFFAGQLGYYDHDLSGNQTIIRLVEQARMKPNEVAPLIRREMAKFHGILLDLQDKAHAPVPPPVEGESVLEHHKRYASVAGAQGGLQFHSLHYAATLYVLANIEELDPGSLAAYLREENLKAHCKDLDVLFVHWFFGQEKYKGTEAAKRHTDLLTGLPPLPERALRMKAYPVPAEPGPAAGKGDADQADPRTIEMLDLARRRLEGPVATKDAVVKNFLDFADSPAARP